MTYYRILTNLSMGSKILNANTVQDFNMSDEHIQKLLRLGVIAQISTPPLSALPLLKDKAAKLETLGIITLEDFLKAEYDILKSIWIKRDVIEKYKQELIDTYLIIKKNKDCNC